MNLINCPLHHQANGGEPGAMSLVDMRLDVDEIFPSAYSPTSCPPRRSNSVPFMFIDCYSRRRSTSSTSSSRSSLFYNKLPEQPLKLTVLKLDGSSFEIEVMKSATVAEVRQAVEEVFSHVPAPGQISWPHVWGHFCLCYNGQKLLVEGEGIRSYGIRDGDQLEFIRHISTHRSASQKRSTWRVPAPNKPKISWPSNNYKREEQSDREEDDHVSQDVETGIFWRPDEEEGGVTGHDGPMWSCIVRPWSPYASARLPTTEETRALKPSAPRSDYGLLGPIRKIIKFCSRSRYSLGQAH
ncbi:hypothetical protein Tsubulata_016227 [Turnera subulata]|uniref:SNRNP25 ubiquitin-like domain-containing protein n=1 Tax=Turnera subulata TaxID=218843 RepID=A0A9Q0GGT8_9ROSI|nr:hypothetical protein Tsubulata_016227 [Turnera subulata]